MMVSSSVARRLGRDRLLPHHPFEEVGIFLVHERLEPVEFRRVEPIEMGVGERPENQVHFLGPPMPGAVAQPPTAHRQIFTGCFFGGHERVVSGDVRPVYALRPALSRLRWNPLSG